MHPELKSKTPSLIRGLKQSIRDDLIVLRNLLLGALMLTSFVWIGLLLNLLLPPSQNKDGQRSNYASDSYSPPPPVIHHTHSPAFSNVGQPGTSTWGVSGGISGASGARGR
jgi:hypothetical protein